MTRDGLFKKQVRARMHETGENYLSALLALRPLSPPTRGRRRRKGSRVDNGEQVREVVGRVVGRDLDVSVMERDGVTHVAVYTVEADERMGSEVMGRLQDEVAKALGDQGVRVHEVNRARFAAMKCSFCGKAKDEVEKLVAGPNEVSICSECIDLAARIVQEERTDA